MNQSYSKKLIEVALPLDAVNAASAREKSIRHGNPSTLHLWWARRPLATARAVLFAQMVDDPSAHPDLFPTEAAQEKERQRLFRIIEKLVLWENTTNEAVLEEAREEIRQSWRFTCADQADNPRASELFNRDELPPFYDPFAGGGALPLEAQRLGLESYASDLNPVAVLINKAMIEIPPVFAGCTPVGPDGDAPHALMSHGAPRAEALAADVRRYGQWMRDEAEKRIGHLYPKTRVTSELAADRPELRKYVGKDLNVIAWLWARTVESPNPAFAGVEVPLASNFMLSSKKNKEAYVEPVVEGRTYRFEVKSGSPPDPELAKRGTKSGGSHSAFLCLMSGTPMSFEYIRDEARAGRMGLRLLAVVAEGQRERVYLSPTADVEDIALSATPDWKPELEISHWPGRTNVVEYGLTEFGDLFTDRQLVALNTFSELVSEARSLVEKDAVAAGRPDDHQPLDEHGHGATAYADAVASYLAFGVSRLANRLATICIWNRVGQKIEQVFARQAIPMTWDFAEANPFSDSSGGWTGSLEWVPTALESLPSQGSGKAFQADAARQETSDAKVISTDPPYYDNIGYADLADFFYVWLRRSLRAVYPGVFATVSVPKAEELVASPYRHGGRESAEKFFLGGMRQAMRRLAETAHPAFPVTIYYAFKQTETRGDGGVSNTGWETFLDAVIQAGFGITGTWPMRTERNFGVKTGHNVLASSIVLVCRPRPVGVPTATRRELTNALKAELPVALDHLQRGNVAPVDLAQAAIGPGMAVFTRYDKVLEADGSPMSVRQAIALINQTLDDTMAEQEGDFDADSRWALSWFENYGFAEGDYGAAETLSSAKNTSVAGMVQAGIVESRGGKVRLLRPEELPESWDPASDSRLTVWETVHQLVRRLEEGELAAAELVGKLGPVADASRELAYRLYTICERKKRTQDALTYNALVQSWPDLARLASESSSDGAQQSLGV